jgi:hypothetical protein
VWNTFGKLNGSQNQVPYRHLCERRRAHAPVDGTACPKHDGRPQQARAAVANPEHVERLKKGTAEWNAWRLTRR